MFHKHYIIVDDFYPNPDSVRQLALSTPMQPNVGNYAGSMTQQKFWTEHHSAVFQTITNEPVDISPGLCGYFRFTTKSEKGRQNIHFDPKPNQVWAGLVHLSLQTDIDANERPQRRCGTVFWRHDRTGLDSIPLTQAGIEQHGWNGIPDLRHFLETDGLNEDLWTETFYVPPRYNRLVLFRPWMFHSPGHAFGTTNENCRLVQLIFLQLIDQQPTETQDS